jgi:transposase-like protein
MAARDRNSSKRSASSEADYTRVDLEREFPDDATCLDWLWRQHFSDDGEHADCPKCGQRRKFHRVKTRASYSCDTCGHHLHPTANTIFHKSSTGLHLWFRAVFLMGSTRCGISAKEIERELGVTYKTAWRMAHLIRTKLMGQDDEPLSGAVEADEMYVGGRRRGSKKGRPSKGSHKVPVLGMVERGGRVAAMTVENASALSLIPRMEKRILPSSTVYTDEWTAYQHLQRSGYNHRRIHHASGVYVMGDIHTNTIEGFWSLVKRGIGGVYHSVSAKHLQGYLDEYVWRYNHRDDDMPMFRTLLDLASRRAD